jgi:hypothetical protein
LYNCKKRQLKKHARFANFGVSEARARRAKRNLPRKRAKGVHGQGEHGEGVVRYFDARGTEIGATRLAQRRPLIRYKNKASRSKEARARERASPAAFWAERD